MLDKYLAAPVTITEKLSLPLPLKNPAEVVRDKVNETRELLRKWQAAWEEPL